GVAVTRSRLLVAFASVLMFASLVVLARPEPTTQPSDQKASKASKSGRWGFSPYNLLSDVTEEQKAQVNEIHRKANSERKSIDERERMDVLAVLTPEQKDELEKILAERKAKAAERRAKAKPGAGSDDKEEDEDKGK
ncbi:MAG: hypothetical protein ACREJC_07890, partial [Tepidisphaeraceae bacterium]